MIAILHNIVKTIPGFTFELTRIMLGYKLGFQPIPDRLRKMANTVENDLDQREELVTQLKAIPDFQSREYLKQRELQSKSNSELGAFGDFLQNDVSNMRFFSTFLRAYADNSPELPEPPSDFFNVATRDELSSANDILIELLMRQVTKVPFDPHNFESETIAKEYQQLVVDHKILIDFGSTYGEFDPIDKLSYLNQIEQIEERWDAVIFRLKLMNALQEPYMKQCKMLLRSMKVTEDEYRELLKEAHRLMRLDAERERDEM
jgi:hypothetical protein